MRFLISRIFCICLAVCILSSLTSFAFATDCTDCIDCESVSTDSEMNERVYEVCGGLPYHKMVASGFANAFLEDETFYIANGGSWQCENCYTVMVTEGQIIFNQMMPIGKWVVTTEYLEPIPHTGVNVVHPYRYDETQDTSLPGYKFFSS